MSVGILVDRDTSWAERCAVTTVFFGSGLGIGAWAASVPTFKDRFALSDGALSIALLAFAAGAVVSMPLAGLLAPRFGAARLIRLTALLFAATLLLPPLAWSLPSLVVAVFAMGAGQGSLDVAMNAYASGVEQRWKGPIMSSFHAAWSAGGLAGAALGAALAGSSRAMVVAMVIATILIAGAWMAFRDGAPTLSAGPRLMLPQRAALPLCVAALLCLLCEGAMVDWSAVYLRTVAEMPSGQAAVGYAAFAATMLIGRVTGDRVVRSLGRPQVVAMGGLLAAAGLALVIILPMPLTVTVGFALVGIGMSNIVPILFSAAGRLWTSPSLGVAMVATTGYAGFLLGPVIIGAIAQSAGLRIGMWVLVGCAGIVALLANAVRAEQP